MFFSLILANMAHIGRKFRFCDPGSRGTSPILKKNWRKWGTIPHPGKSFIKPFLKKLPNQFSKQVWLGQAFANVNTKAFIPSKNKIHLSFCTYTFIWKELESAIFDFCYGHEHSWEFMSIFLCVLNLFPKKQKFYKNSMYHQ